MLKIARSIDPKQVICAPSQIMVTCTLLAEQQTMITIEGCIKLKAMKSYNLMIYRLISGNFVF